MNQALSSCLDAPFIDPDRIYTVLIRHYASVLPFLHHHTFTQCFRNRKAPVGLQHSMSDVNDGNLMLVVALALACQSDTAICREASLYLEKVRSNSGPDSNMYSVQPLQPPHYYARVALDVLGTDNDGNSTVWSPGSMEQIQALVMLGMYEWLCKEGPENYPQGFAHWLSSGRGVSRSLDLFRERMQIETNTRTSEPNYRRQGWLRTLLSVTIMDRLLITAPTSEALLVETGQLPLAMCMPEHEFEGERVPNGYHKDGYGVDAVLVWLLRILDIFSEVNWFCSQGSRVRNNCPILELPPSQDADMAGRIPHQKQQQQQQSTSESHPRFLVLAAHVDKFRDSFPRHFVTNNIDNRTKAIVRDTMILENLCRLMLYRDRIPFIPLQNLATKGRHPHPKGREECDIYVISAAKEAYMSARKIIQIAHAANLDRASFRNVSATLPLSPIVVNAVWHAALASLHAHHFPHLDQTYALVSPDYQVVLNYGFTFNPRSQGSCGQAFVMLGYLASYWRSARRYRRIFRWAGAFLHLWRQAVIKALFDPPNIAPSALSSDQCLMRMRNDDFHSGFQEWEVFRHRYMTIGYEQGREKWEDDDLYPMFGVFDNAEEFPDYPDYEKYDLDMDMINAWTLVSSLVPQVSASVEVVCRVWDEVAHLDPLPGGMAAIFQGADVTTARLYSSDTATANSSGRNRISYNSGNTGSNRDGSNGSSGSSSSVPPLKWHPLLTIYPATRMWRWNEHFPADCHSLMLKNMWRRAIKVDANVAIGNYHFQDPSQLQTHTANFLPIVAWLPSFSSKPKTGVAGNLRNSESRTRLSSDISNPPFSGWTVELPTAVVAETCALVALDVLGKMTIRTSEFSPRSFGRAIVDDGVSQDGPTWQPPLPQAQQQMAPYHHHYGHHQQQQQQQQQQHQQQQQQQHQQRQHQHQPQHQPHPQSQPRHHYSNSFTMQDIALAPTPGNTIPTPVNSNGYFREGYHINGYYIDSSVTQGPAAPHSRQSVGRHSLGQNGSRPM
ncbi:hypothetical protein Cpir12675_006372 [Ceratocystis pirilliformis]|uniref:Transcription factor domain-containing protein n=1 Tax=Ceratocystis pirilliformis TaxID=259994 RepID=A0ABR3YIP2_9PEZI